MRNLALSAWVLAAAFPALGTTLQQLSLTDLILKSTAIVRGRAQQSSAAPRGSVIYTHYSVQVSETWKGVSVPVIDVAVPGGRYNSMTQTYSGAPAFAPGQEYVFFLWTSRTGLTQVIGLSQGLFSITHSSAGISYANRTAATESLLTSNGAAVSDSNLNMPLADLKAHVLSTLGKAGK